MEKTKFTSQLFTARQGIKYKDSKYNEPMIMKKQKTINIKAIMLLEVDCSKLQYTALYS